MIAEKFAVVQYSISILAHFMIAITNTMSFSLAFFPARWVCTVTIVMNETGINPHRDFVIITSHKGN